MTSPRKTVAAPEIESRIFTLRGEKVLLDADLARIYGVPTKALNRAVKRNHERFPEDFLFRLTDGEVMRCQIGAASKRNVRYLPNAFTEHGALMAANVLNSPRAAEMSVYVIRAFVRMRRELGANETVARRLAEIEKTLLKHDGALRDLYEKIRPLLLPPPEPKRREIGFHVKYDESAKSKKEHQRGVSRQRRHETEIRSAAGPAVECVGERFQPNETIPQRK